MLDQSFLTISSTPRSRRKHDPHSSLYFPVHNSERSYDRSTESSQDRFEMVCKDNQIKVLRHELKNCNQERRLLQRHFQETQGRLNAAQISTDALNDQRIQQLQRQHKSLEQLISSLRRDLALRSEQRQLDLKRDQLLLEEQDSRIEELTRALQLQRNKEQLLSIEILGLRKQVDMLCAERSF